MGTPPMSDDGTDGDDDRREAILEFAEFDRREHQDIYADLADE